MTPLPEKTALKKPSLIRVNLKYNQCSTIVKLIIECPVKNYNLQGFEKKIRILINTFFQFHYQTQPTVVFCKKWGSSKFGNTSRKTSVLESVFNKVAGLY